MRKLMKKSIIFLSIFLFMFGWVIRSNVHASTPAELYDNVWRLVNTKFVDQTNNSQDWSKWRHKYDKEIKEPFTLCGLCVCGDSCQFGLQLLLFATSCSEPI